MIGHVEELRTELDSLRLGDLEILARGKIELREARAGDGISRDRAYESHLITEIRPWHGCARRKTRIVVRCAWSVADAIHACPAHRWNELIHIEPGVRISGHRILISFTDKVRCVRCPSHGIRLRR